MPVVIDEALAHAPRLALAADFAGWPPDGSGDRGGLWRRLWFTLGALIVYRLSTFFPMPGIDPVALAEFFQRRASGILGLIDLLSGGAMQRFSITALGIAPYVSALVIVHLASYLVPRLGGLAIEGPAGRRALNQYARILTVALAGLQAIGFAIAFQSVRGMVLVPGHAFEVLTVVTLIAGALFLLWLAEQITARGIGDGVIAILACGIASRLPFGITHAVGQVRTGETSPSWLPVTLGAAAAIILVVVLVERAVCRVWIHDPGGEIGTASATPGFTQIPLPLNPSGVLVPLAASVFIAPLRGIVADLTERDASWLERLVSSGMGYALIDGSLIFFFAIFFGLAAFDPDQIARKLKDSGGWIPGVRPGDNTARYLRRTRTVLALGGAVYLVVVCVLPDVVYRWFHLPLPLSGFSLFLLAWMMIRMLDSMRPFLRP